jgi:hypothetical protein
MGDGEVVDVHKDVAGGHPTHEQQDQHLGDAGVRPASCVVIGEVSSGSEARVPLLQRQVGRNRQA